MKELKIESYDSIKLHCYIWDEVENPKGVVQLAHGMAEHAGRYAPFAEFLNKNGYIVFGDDHRAHGKTESDIDIGHHEGDIYQKTLDDLVFLYRYAQNLYNLPIVFVGHSYGSFLGQGFLQKYTDVKGVALCGTANMGKMLPALGLSLLNPICFFASSYKPKMVNKASDILFNKAYKGEKGASLWLTRDEEQRKMFIEDNLSGINMSFNFDRSMMKAFIRLYKRENLAKLNSDTPIGIFSGTMDPIGGKNSIKAVKLKELYDKCGVKDCCIKLYDGARHELFNEINREEFFADILAFINKCIEKNA